MNEGLDISNVFWGVPTVNLNRPNILWAERSASMVKHLKSGPVNTIAYP